MSLEIRRKDSASKGRYVHAANGTPEAEMTFSKAGEHLLIIDHTEVPDAYRGQGVGAALVLRAVEEARAAHVEAAKKALAMRRAAGASARLNSTPRSST